MREIIEKELKEMLQFLPTLSENVEKYLGLKFDLKHESK